MATQRLNPDLIPLDPSPDFFPLDLLPDRILTGAFSRFSLLQQITCFRTVCHRWNCLVESQCSERKSLKLLGDSVGDISDYYHNSITGSDLTDDPDLKLKPAGAGDDDLLIQGRNFHDNFAAFLLRLFPNLESLAVVIPESWFEARATARYNLVVHLLGRWAPTLRKLSLFGQVDQQPKSFHAKLVAVLAKDLLKLTHLDIFAIQLFDTLEQRTQMAVVFERLERLSISGFHFPKICLLRHLGPKARELSLMVYLKWTDRNIRKVFDPKKSFSCNQWITSLKIPIERESTLDFICSDAFPQLKTLSLDLCGFDRVVLNEKFVAQINKLKNLKQLRLGSIYVDLSLLTRSPGIVIPGLTELHLDNLENRYEQEHRTFDGRAFWRLIILLFPRLDRFYLRTELQFYKLLLQTHEHVFFAEMGDRNRFMLTVNGMEPIGKDFWSKPSFGRHEEAVKEYKKKLLEEASDED